IAAEIEATRATQYAAMEAPDLARNARGACGRAARLPVDRFLAGYPCPSAAMGARGDERVVLHGARFSRALDVASVEGGAAYGRSGRAGDRTADAGHEQSVDQQPSNLAGRPRGWQRSRTCCIARK